MPRSFCLTISLLAVASSAFSQPDEATFEGLGDLPGGGTSSQALDTSANGFIIVGVGSSEDGFEAFRWENGTMLGLGDLPGGSFLSEARGTSADGSVVVGYSSSENGDEAFRWEDSSIEGLGSLKGGDFFSFARDISADGSVVVGISSSSRGNEEAFRWTEDDGMVGLGDLEGGAFHSGAEAVSADGSVIVGRGQVTTGTDGFRWENGEMENLGSLSDGSFLTIPYGISADGSVVVGLSVSESGPEAFRWEDSEMEGLGDLGGETFYSEAKAVTADGSIVVGESRIGPALPDDQRAFIWTADEGMRDLKDVLEEDYGLDLTGWTLRAAWDISNDGAIIVGYGVNPDGNVEAWRATGLLPVADESFPEESKNVLSAPRPNPVRGTSTISVTAGRGQEISVGLYDITGRRIQTLYEGTLAGGASETLTLDASTLPAGAYLIRATGKHFTQTQRITILH